MYVQPSIRIPFCIEQGSVYLYTLEATNADGSEYRGDRFFIVLNTNPKTDQVLVVATITKQVKKKKRLAAIQGEDPSTVVTITPKDFLPLNVESVVDCNKVYDITLKALIGKIESGGKIFSQKLPQTIINNLVSGVLKSNQVSQDFKKLLI